MKNLLSFYLDATRLALQAILAHKLRTFLTLIGIIIGVASVVVVGASISGLNTYVIERVSRLLGINHFMIARIAHVGHMTQEEWEKMIRRNRRIEWEDFEWMQTQCNLCAEVGATSETQMDLRHEGRELFGTRIIGVTANMAEIEDKTISEGRFIAPHEVERSAPVCVIGMELREKFFEARDPIGQTLKLGEMPMRIVGVEEKRGSMFGQSLDNHVYIPVTTFCKIFGRRQGLEIHGKAPDRERLFAAIEQARVAMRNRRKLKGAEEDNFGLVNVEQLNNQVDQFTGTIALVVTPITLISLIVGGIVIMNIMLVSVTERTFEIGLRKAVGARKKQILMQFLIESSLLAAVGGLLGLLLAAAISWLISATTPIPMTITIFYVLLSLLVSGGIGMIFGIYPAYKAARLDPIVALSKN